MKWKNLGVISITKSTLPNNKYSRGLILEFIRKKLSTDILWAVRAYKIIYKNHLDLTSNLVSPSYNNLVGWTRLDEPIANYLSKYIINETYFDDLQIQKKIMKLVSKYSVQIFQYSDPDKLIKVLDSYYEKI